MPFFLVNKKKTSKRGLNHHCTFHFKTMFNNNNNNNNNSNNNNNNNKQYISFNPANMGPDKYL